MVNSIFVKCPSCGQIFNLKYQLDQTIYLFEWPIQLECPTCGDITHIRYGPKGLFPKNVIVDHQDEGIIVGYSSCLPITEPLFYQSHATILFSPYLTLSQLYDGQVISHHSAAINVILENVFPYRHCFKELLPIMHKNNPRAFSNKMAHVFGHKKFQPIETMQKCNDAYDELLEKTYINFSPLTYSESSQGEIFKQMLSFVQSAPHNVLVDLKDKTSSCVPLSNWKLNEAYKYLSTIINRVEILFPAMFFGTTGEYNIPRVNTLYTVTADCDEINKFYSEGFEVLVHILPFIVGLHNQIKNGDSNKFVVDGNSVVGDLLKFSKLQSGIMVQAISQSADLCSYFKDTIDNHIRNGIYHYGIKYDPEAQIIEYHYDPNKDEIHDEHTLIDMCFMVYMQMLHVLEAVALINVLNSRTK